MLRRRGASPPVMAEIPAGEGRDAATVGRAGLDAYRRLLKGIGGARAVLATGPQKSQVAVGLASAAVADGRRAILLECDLSSPSLAARLSLAAAPGLTEYLTHRAEAPQILQPLVLAGPVGGRASEPLVCVVAGESTADAAGLLESAELRHAMGKLRGAYDLAVIDAPPMDEEEALVATVREVDFTIAACRRGDLPKHLRPHVDGIVEPAG